MPPFFSALVLPPLVLSLPHKIVHGPETNKKHFFLIFEEAHRPNLHPRLKKKKKRRIKFHHKGRSPTKLNRDRCPSFQLQLCFSSCDNWEKKKDINLSFSLSSSNRVCKPTTKKVNILEMGVSCEAVFSALFVIATGLLFIDLVPLQETMRCPGNYTNATECPEVFFSSTYQQARNRFLAAAEAAHGAIEHHRIFTEGSVDYFMDTAFFQGKQPGKLLVHASGTHGVEGYTGSAIQVKLLQEWNATARSGPSILFVHAVNPYGMSHFRRFNEENVDLNRNYLTEKQWQQAKERDPNIAGYEDLRSVLVPDVPPRFIDRYVFLLTAAKTVARHGFTKLKRAFVTGQYHDPNGIYYGGDKEQKSVSVLRAVLKAHVAAAHATETIYIDVHTGLGPTGVDTFMVSDAQEEAKAKQVFHGARVQNDQTASSGPSSGYNLAMGVIRPIDELGANALVVTEEFGTVHGLFVARATILENAAYRLCRGSYVHAVMQTWVRDAFYPQERNFKESTLSRGSAAFWKAFQHLANETAQE